MATRSLYETAQLVRKVAFITVVGMVSILVVNFAFNKLTEPPDPFYSGFSFYAEQSEFDTVEVPQLPLNTLQIANDNPSFLVEGVFPESPDSVLVYTIERPRVKLDYEDRAVETATALGFIPGTNYTSLNGDRKTDLLWENLSKTRSLKYNAETYKWQMRTFYFEDSLALQPKIILPNIGAYRQAALNMMNRIGLGSGFGLDSPYVNAVYGRLGNDALFTNPINSTTANYVVIDIHRVIPATQLKPASERPQIPAGYPIPTVVQGRVYKQDPRNGSLQMVVGDAAATSTRDIYEVDFVDYEYRTSPLIRPAIKAEVAWDMIRQGEGKLRLLKTQTSDYFADSQILNVQKFILDADNVELGFYEPEDWDGYLYPIYIFRGRAELNNGLSGEFVFYMDAIDRDAVNFR